MFAQVAQGMANEGSMATAEAHSAPETNHGSNLALNLNDFTPGPVCPVVFKAGLHITMGLAAFRILLVLSPLMLWIFSFGPRDGIAVASQKPSGREIYLQNCAACHVNGVAQAPRVSVRVEWEPRLATGRQSLLESVLRGKGGMPPKGGNASISDAQAMEALDYIVARVLESEHEAETAQRRGP
jgi:cytochrome c5